MNQDFVPIDDSYFQCQNNHGFLKTLDLTLRILYTIVQLGHFIYGSLLFKSAYTNSEQRIILLSVVLVLLGIQNCSIAFYPWVKNL